MWLDFMQRLFICSFTKMENKRNMETSEKIQGSGILQVFASLLIPQSSCTAKVANVIAEIAKNGEVFLKSFSAGNIFSFTPYLSVFCHWVGFSLGILFFLLQ
ncbi:hypothetical protein FD755_020058 [Muntiacus reevesi]|uniref:Uncharacterized protein n=2 Tax=Muntiacus TaxID=9885 RepID=A0A5N3X3Q8_MUNRE|nr:hypothetical protein FD755_020058 [Muntiacus reevesi]